MIERLILAKEMLDRERHLLERCEVFGKRVLMREELIGKGVFIRERGVRIREKGAD